MRPSWGSISGTTSISQGATYIIPSDGWYIIRTDTTSGSASEVSVASGGTDGAINRIWGGSDHGINVPVYFKKSVKIKARTSHGKYWISKVG